MIPSRLISGRQLVPFSWWSRQSHVRRWTQGVEHEHSVKLVDVQAAAKRIEGLVHRTPVLRNATMDKLAGRELLFKCELFQKTGCFKARGACNAVLKLPEDISDVVTHSSGNHAAALAWAVTVAKRKTPVTANIVMPEGSPALKIAAVQEYGGKITQCAPTNAARAETADDVCKQTGGKLIHPSNDPDIIAGQGTVGLELIEQGFETWPSRFGPDVGGLDCIVVPIGGGGLCGGISVATKEGVNGKIRVIAAEPALADDAFRSKASGKIEDHRDGKNPETIADGLKTLLGDNNFPLIRDYVDDIVLVSEEDIVAATRLVWERMKLMIEPSAGVGVAAVMSDTFRKKHGDCKRVGVVLCGGNSDATKVVAAFEKASGLPSGCVSR